MARTIACPKCSEKFKVEDEQLGTQVSCPSCGASLKLPKPPGASAPKPPAQSPVSRAPMPPAMPPKESVAAGRPTPSRARDDEDEDRGRRRYDDEDDDRGRRRNRRDDYDAPSGGERWGPTSVGLKMLFWSAVVVFIFVVLIQAMTALQVGALQNGGAPFGPNGPGGAFVGIMMVGGCMMIIGGIVAYVGMCMSCSAPHRPAARLALVTVLTLAGMVLGFFALVFILAATIGQAAANQPQVGAAANNQQIQAILQAGFLGLAGLVFIGILYLTSIICWMLFHAVIAGRFGNSGLRTQSIVFLVVYLIYQAINLAMQFFVTPGAGLGTLTLFMWVSMAISSVIYVWYLVICFMTFRTIDRGAAAALSDRGRDDY